MSDEASSAGPKRAAVTPQPRIQAYVAERAETAQSQRAPAADGDESILDHELRFIMERRRHMAAKAGRGKRDPKGNRKEDIEDVVWPDDLAGLAFSGGGIRSSTFCLGVAQALNQYGVIDRLDYLSTVSGGSYFGSALTSTLIQSGGKFVFGGSDEPSGTEAKRGAMSSEDLKDSKAVGHLRNYSNYLVPKGMWDTITACGIVVRGLVANATLSLWLPLLLAAITAAANPMRTDLARPDLFGVRFGWYPIGDFGLTLLVAITAFVAFLAWALVRSGHARDDLPDVDSWPPKIAALVLVLVLATAFYELQPFLLTLMFDSADAVKAAEMAAAQGGPPVDASLSPLKWAAILLGGLTAFVTFFRETLKAYLADTYYSKTWSAVLARSATAIVLWVGALALPALIWILYLYLSYWAIGDNGPLAEAAFAHSPIWLRSLTEVTGTGAGAIYLTLAAILAFTAFWLKPNANSLHNLYRDRLARAFHFDPTTLPADADEKLALAPQREKDPAPISRNLQDMLSPDAPYHLINTAINVGSSTQANRRGRNADFFLLSPLFVGSRVTGYVPTYAYGDKGIGEPIDLAKAVAISGAAASSTMGSQTVRLLSPTLALLNVRLGYWMTNPAALVERLEWRRRRKALFYRFSGGEPPAAERRGGRKARRWSRMRRALSWLTANGHWFLFAEMFGIMKEHHGHVYLTDGGHIENLGIYEMLRRRCKVIVAVDAEADPQMRFGSFIALQIYARIDLGVRIDLPVEGIRRTTLAAMAAGRRRKPEDGEDTGPAAGHAGPHIAIGRIHYGDNEFGTLVYVKASLSGDENDYIRDYSRRNPLFPHEATSDQFFTEEQFEVYRALGFHCVSHFLSGRDKAMVDGDREPKLRTIADARDPRIADLRRTLGPF